MKLSAVSNINYEDKKQTTPTTQPQTTQPQAKSGVSSSYRTNYLSQNNNVSFGGLGSASAGVANTIFKFIDRSSFFIEFLIVDTISMVAPRILVGLNRDKDKLGHLNYKAGIEEAGREVFSGPSMNLIPMGILIGASAMKPASRMDRDTLTGLSETFKDAIIKNKDAEVSSKQLAEQIFDYNFSAMPNEKEGFVNILEKATQKHSKEERKNLIKEFTNKVSELNYKCSTGEVAPTHPGNLNLKVITKDGKPSSYSIGTKDLLEDFGAFSKDIISRVKAKKFKGDEATKLVDTLKSNRSALKLGTAIAAFLAVGAFLKNLPKLYQQKGLSPAQESALRASQAAQNKEAA